jgi:hypothetical protein
MELERGEEEMGHGRGTGIDEMGKKNTTKGEIYTT